jgi:outer membrane receptor protein involved in Fe transport
MPEGGRAMRRANLITKVLLGLLVVLFASSVVWAGTTGKIRGRVINEGTKDPVPFAPVRIEGTTMGALTDSDGEYIIINVSPGKYDLIAEAVGYIKKRTTGVEVKVDRSASVDFELEETAIDIGIVQEVVAKRDILRLTETQSTRQMTSEEIENMPVTSVEEILTAQVGIVERFGELHIRGGRANEMTYVVDGVTIRDPLGGYGAVEKAMNISGNVVEDLQIIKSGFEAEYGNAVSGVVNVTTKGGTSVTKGHFEYFTDDFGTEILNKNSFNYDRVEFNLSGPEPVFSDRLLPKLGIDWFADGKLKYSLSGSFDKSDGYVSYKDYFSPTVNRDFPTNSLFGLMDLTDRTYNEYEARAKLTWQASPKIKVTFDYSGSWDDNTPFAYNFVYTPATASWTHDEASIYSLRLTHSLDRNTFYEVMVSRYARDVLDTPSDPSQPGGRMLPDEFLQYNQWEYFQDGFGDYRGGDGIFQEPEPFINVNQDTSWAWGGDFYTVGDAYLYAAWEDTETGRLLGPFWPTLDMEFGGFDWQDKGAKYSDWRGVDPMVNGATNSSTYVDTILTDWNGNGRVDLYESEPFVDVNGDGRWNANDYFYPFYDANGNGRYDADHASPINIDHPEPFLDGDRILGEPFTDVNLNGYYDAGIDIFVMSNDPMLNQDLNYNSSYDGPSGNWSPGTPFEDLNGNGLFDRANGQYDYGEPFIDQNGNGKWDDQDGFLDRGYDRWCHYNEKSYAIWTADFKLTKQFSKEHEVKLGLATNFDNLNYADLQYPYYPYDGVPDGGPYGDIGVFRDFYSRSPIRGSVFLQDRMEYGAMIANLGMRYDFFIQSAELKTEASEGFGDSKSIEGSKNKFSPRIGFSYPISDKAKVFFNYGHFYQLPELTRMYQRATQASNAFGIIGNENLDYVRTIQYEFGVEYLLSADYVVKVSGFYKDEFDKINSVSRSYGPISQNEYENVDYGRTRGLEMELRKTYGNYVSGWMNYAYMFAYGKSSSERSNYFDDFYSRSIPITEFPLNWDQRHEMTLNLDLRVPKDDHPKLFGLKLPGNWGVNALWQFGSGFPFTPDRDFPGLELAVGESPQNNSMRYPSTTNVDVRAWKRFPLLGLDFTVDLWVDNLFDNENIEYVYGLTGRYDTSSKPVGANYVFEGADISNNPRNLGPGRNIRIGLGLDF